MGLIELLNFKRNSMLPRESILLTTDPNDPRLCCEIDSKSVPQHLVYLVLDPTDDNKLFKCPIRTQYKHQNCGNITTMNIEIAETYAREPTFYDVTYCSTCMMHRPVGEFYWLDGKQVGI
jgi:hypothetical protein